MKKVLIKFSFILLFFLLIGTTYAEDIENENITCETKKNTTIESDDLEMFYCDGSSFQIKLTGEDVSNKIVSMSIMELVIILKQIKKDMLFTYKIIS